MPPALPPPLISSISPSNKPALSRQRDHSACRRPETPLKVRKTREILKQHSIYADIPPPCLHLPHEHAAHCSCPGDVPNALGTIGSNVLCEQEQEYGDGLTRKLDPHNVDVPQPVLPPPQSVPAGSRVQRQKSASRRMLSRVKQGIASRTKGTQSIRPVESEISLVRRISGRRKQSCEIERRAQSFEISRDSIDSCVAETPGSVGSGPSVERSFTDSTVSTAEVFGDASINGISQIQASYFDKPVVLDLSQGHNSSPPPPSSPSPQPTPRPPRKISPPILPESPLTLLVTVPCVDLDVALDCTTLDVHAKRDVWIAVKATVRASTATIDTNMKTGPTGPSTYKLVTSDDDGVDARSFGNQVCGTITTLRLCFKPMRGCRIRDVIGRKTMKDLKLDQECHLFIRLHVPKIRTRDDKADPDQDSLFTELESIVGTLETEILHVEARYRHSMLPSDNVVTVRHICKIKRPKSESRWSMISSAGNEAPSTDAQKRLARYIASEYPIGQALELMQAYLDPNAKQEVDICEIRNSLVDGLCQQQASSNDDLKPAVVVTDIDWNPSASAIQITDHFSTAPSTPAAADCPSQPPSAPFHATHKRQPSSTSLLTPTIFAPPLISAPKTTTALSKLASQSSNALGSPIDPSSGSQDTARQLWRHIRRTSLSAKQLEEMTPERLEHLEASDDTLREIRRRALANKRSIGAETLKAWKWDDNIRSHERFVEAPWM